MNAPNRTNEVHIHLRANARDRDLIDQAAEAIGANRSQFMLASSLKEAKNVLLDQTTLSVDAKTFQDILKRLDDKDDPIRDAGIARLMSAPLPWAEAPDAGDHHT